MIQVIRYSFYRKMKSIILIQPFRMVLQKVIQSVMKVADVKAAPLRRQWDVEQ